MSGTLFDEPDGPWALRLDSAAAYAAEGFRFGATLQRIDRGEADLCYNVNAEAAGGAGGGVHGGMQSFLLDMGGVAAALTTLKRGQLPRGTAHLEISFLKPAISESLIVKARVKQSGNRLAVVLVDIEDGDNGKTVATGKILYAIGGKAVKWVPKQPTPENHGAASALTNPFGPPAKL
jgi:uncharacterized protein (TIGR00369 family)